MLTVIIIGGSASNGVGGAGKGWFDLLKFDLESRFEDAIVYGLAVYGDTSSQVAERFDSEVIHRVRMGRTVVILQVGGNDTAQHRVSHEYLVSPERFEANLSQILDIVREHELELIVQLILPVNEDATASTSVDDRVAAVTPRRIKTNKAVELYNTVLRRIYEGHATVVDIGSSFGAQPSDYLCDDGVHPNRKGHALIYEKFKAIIEKEA